MCIKICTRRFWALFPSHSMEWIMITTDYLWCGCLFSTLCDCVTYWFTDYTISNPQVIALVPSTIFDDQISLIWWRVRSDDVSSLIKGAICNIFMGCKQRRSKANSELSFAALRSGKGLSITEKPRERYTNLHETGTRSRCNNVNRELRSTNTEDIFI